MVRGRSAAPSIRCPDRPWQRAGVRVVWVPVVSLTVGCDGNALPMHMASLVLVFLSSGCGLSTSHYYRDHASRRRSEAVAATIAVTTTTALRWPRARRTVCRWPRTSSCLPLPMLGAAVGARRAERAAAHESGRRTLRMTRAPGAWTSLAARPGARAIWRCRFGGLIACLPVVLGASPAMAQTDFSGPAFHILAPGEDGWI